MSDTSSAPTPVAETAITPEQVQEFNRHVKGYLTVGAVQIVFTVIAVVLAFWPFEHRSTSIIAVLLAAAINAVVVALIQMHLKSENKTIWNFLLFTGIFLCVLFGLTLLAWSDPIIGTQHTHHPMLDTEHPAH
jgi:heme/copper-type cytochrome/quinol oxidase subunit 4